MNVTAISTGTVELSTSSTSTAIDQSVVLGVDSRHLRPDGFYSLQYTITGDGTANITYEVSNDGTTYDTPEDKDGTAVPNIATGLTKTSGPGSDGKGIVGFSPIMARYIRIVTTETGGADSVTGVYSLGIL